MGKGKRIRAQRKAEQARREPAVFGPTPAADALMRERMAQGFSLMQEIPRAEDLPAAIEKRVMEVERLLADHDALHFLANFAFANFPSHPDEYVESEERASVAQVELAAAILLRRTSRRNSDGELPPIGKEVMDSVKQQLEELLQLLSFQGYSGAAQGAQSWQEATVRARSASQSLYLHAPGFHWQEEATIEALFAPSRISEDLLEILGFDAKVGLACCRALENLLNDGMERRRQESLAAAMAAQRGEEGEPVRWVRAVFGSDLTEEQIPSLVAMAWTFRDWGDVLGFTADEMADAAGVSQAEAASFLDALSVQLGEVDHRLRTATEQIRLRPFVDNAEGRYQPSFPGNALWALRPLFEGALSNAGGAVWERYQAHRGSWVERRSSELLSGVLRPDESHVGLDYYGELEGERVTGEIDCLFRVGDTLLLVEAKGATVGGRRGGQRLIDKLKRVLTKAAEQASAAKVALERGDALVLKDERGKRVEIGIDRAREVHPIVVTLDDLSVVAPTIWELRGSKLMPEGITLPWVVNLHELELICGLVEIPAQLVHFLRRRSRLNQLGGRTAFDELDWWMLYLRNSLYFEGAPLDHIERYTSLTDPLDAYYFWEKGLRSVEAPKPRQKLESEMRQLLDFLDEHRPPAFVAAACDLLDISGDSRDRIFRDMKRLRGVARKRNRPQRATYGFPEEPGGMVVGFVVAPDVDRPHLLDHLRRFVAERLDEHEVQRMVAIGLSASGEAPIEALIVIEPEVWGLPESESEE